MAGEQMVTSSYFGGDTGSSFSSGTYTYVQRFGRGNNGRMQGTGTSNWFVNDAFVMRVYYYSGGWVQSSAYAYPDDVTTKYTLACNSSHSHRTRWYFFWDARPYGDGKAVFSGSGRVQCAYNINHPSYPKGKHLKLFRLTNWGCSTSNTAATSSSTTKITTAHYVCTKYQ